MINRVIKTAELPAHRISIDDLARVCNVLISRFLCKDNMQCLILLLTPQNVAVCFEGVDDLIANKDSMRDQVWQYVVQIECGDDHVGLQKLEIHPPFYDGAWNVTPTITAYGRHEGWCADIITTALAEFNRHKIGLSWLYHKFVATSTTGLVCLVSGLTAGRLWSESQVPVEQRIVLTAISLTCASLVTWFIFGRGARGKTGEVQIAERKTRDVQPILLIILAVMQVILGIVSILVTLSV